MVCLLPLTAVLNSNLVKETPCFCKSQPRYIANWDNLICVGNTSSRRPRHHKEMFPFVLTMADIFLFVWLDFARNALKNDKWHKIWSSQTNISIALQRCMVRKVEPDSTRSCVLDHLRRWGFVEYAGLGCGMQPFKKRRISCFPQAPGPQPQRPVYPACRLFHVCTVTQTGHR